MRIAIDSGGTFTDCVYIEGGSLRVHKVFSTASHPEAAVLEAARKAASTQTLTDVRHGTTVGTNAMLERKGARVAFVTTAGFEDIIAIGRQARHSLYDWFHTPPLSLVPSDLRFGVDERVSAEGIVLRIPSEESLLLLRNDIQHAGAETIALSLLFAFANPENERRVARALEPLGLPISISHRIIPEFREYERATTIVINSYLAPKVGSYLHRLEEKIEEDYGRDALRIMQSSGGIVPATIAAEEPVRTLLSGPAGGVIGAWHMGRVAGFDKLIAFDMGGTSTDVSLMDASRGGPQMASDAMIAGMPVRVPMLDIHTVGAGGGSIAQFDQGGILRVGPESSGAVPGPACYGQGNQPTVTDANLILGRLDPDYFLGGSIHLDEAHASSAMDAARGPIASIEEFASGILKVAETSMETAIRMISIERGFDTREFTLVSFGGAGPLHACALARALRIPRVLVPRMPGALSAIGILLADTVRDYSRTVMLPENAFGTIATHFSSLRRLAQGDLKEQNLEGEFTYSLDLRYTGQGYELNLPHDQDSVSRFHDLHQQRYGYSSRDTAVEIVNLRLRVTVHNTPIDLPTQQEIPGDGSQAILKARNIYIDGMWTQSNVYQRDLLHAGDTFSGPALIMEYSSTTFLPPTFTARVDRYGNLLLEAITP